MFTVRRSGDNRLDMEIGGKLDADDMRAALDELVSKAEGIESGRMLYTIGDFQLPTMAALAVEFSRLPELFKTIRKFDRAAVLCDKKWVQKVSEFEGVLIPGLEIKSFGLDEVEKAEAWLA
jgi:hypothetical protein